MTLRCTALAVMLAALALSPATAQEAGEQSSGTPAQAGQGGGMMMPGQGMMRGRGKAGGGMYGRHHRGRGAGPTLRIKTAGKGFEIDFECRASLENCLAAIERVYDIAGERRGAGPRSTE